MALGVLEVAGWPYLVLPQVPCRAHTAGVPTDPKTGTRCRDRWRTLWPSDGRRSPPTSRPCAASPRWFRRAAAICFGMGFQALEGRLIWKFLGLFAIDWQITRSRPSLASGFLLEVPISCNKCVILRTPLEHIGTFCPARLSARFSVRDSERVMCDFYFLLDCVYRIS